MHCILIRVLSTVFDLPLPDLQPVWWIHPDIGMTWRIHPHVAERHDIMGRDPEPIHSTTLQMRTLQMQIRGYAPYKLTAMHHAQCKEPYCMKDTTCRDRNPSFGMSRCEALAVVNVTLQSILASPVPFLRTPRWSFGLSLTDPQERDASGES